MKNEHSHLLGFEIWTRDKMNYQIMTPVAAFSYWIDCLNYADLLKKGEVYHVIRTQMLDGTWNISDPSHIRGEAHWA